MSPKNKKEFKGLRKIKKTIARVLGIEFLEGLYKKIILPRIRYTLLCIPGYFISKPKLDKLNRKNVLTVIGRGAFRHKSHCVYI